MSCYELCNFAGGIEWRGPEELEGRNQNNPVKVGGRIGKKMLNSTVREKLFSGKNSQLS